MRMVCPYLGGEVELTQEREKHIEEHHPDLLPGFLDRIAETLANPDQVRLSSRLGSARLFSRWFDDIVVSEIAPRRHWVVTAYLVSKLALGIVEWKRD